MSWEERIIKVGISVGVETNGQGWQDLVLYAIESELLSSKYSYR